MDVPTLSLADDDAQEVSDQRLPVLLPLPLVGPLDYLSPSPAPETGRFVRVPLSGREVIGVVWHGRHQEDREPVARDKLKSVVEILDTPPLTRAQMRFVDWLANYTLSMPGQVLRMCMPVPAALFPAPARTLYVATGEANARLSPKQRLASEAVADGKARSVKAIADLAGVSDAVVRGLIKKGGLVGLEAPLEEPVKRPDIGRPGPELSEAQATAADALREKIAAKKFSVTLLDGVTGSGKTEVYFDSIAAALAEEGNQALVMLPEIALTTQWLGRFEARFGAPPVVWHSDLTQAERRRAWRAIAEGRARAVVGPRSSLFLPFRHLALIVVDEEHDASYKQDEGVLYNARDMAIVRAAEEHAVVILSTATPAIETIHNCNRGRYAHLTLPDRHGGASLPEVTLIDLREHQPPSGRWISGPLEDELSATLDRGEQALLFLNRRGYAPLTLCRKCGARIECPNCSTWLVEHRYRGELVCHHCDYRMRLPDTCESCGAHESLVPCGPGVERLADEVAQLFPEARRLVMTSDTLSGPRRTREAIQMIENAEVDIIIGTQLVTKGYHFPLLTCVGVIDADVGLRGSDLRAAERTYQQLSQVAGRAGREARSGRVFLQTYMPDHPVIAALAGQNVAEFIARELDLRQRQAMPPFGRLASIILSGRDARQVEEAGRRLARACPDDPHIRVLGPAPATLARVKGVFRYRLLVLAPVKVRLQPAIRNWLRRVGSLSPVRVKIDIDPYNFD